MSRHGLLLTSGGTRGRNVARAIRSAGTALTVVDSTEDFQQQVEREPDFAVVDAGDDNVGEEFHRAFLRLSDCELRRRAILYSDVTSRGAFLDLLKADVLYHLIAPAAPGSLDRMATTVAKLFAERPFGVEHYVPWGTRIGGLTLTESDDKDRLLTRLAEFSDAMGIPSRLSALARTVADEFIMNAVYDAPTDRKGRPLFAEVPRSQPIVLPEGHRGRFQFACTGGSLVVAVQDPYGSLKPETVRSNLYRTLSGGEDQIRKDTAGAGMGLYMAFKALSDWIINLVPGRETEMIGMIRTSGTYRDHIAMPKSFHLFLG